MYGVLRRRPCSSSDMTVHGYWDVNTAQRVFPAPLVGRGAVKCSAHTAWKDGSRPARPHAVTLPAFRRKIHGNVACE
jgi:hypothetical protein